MKVRDLIAQLRQLPQDTEVLVSQDEEGNAHLRAHGVWEGMFDPTDTYYVESLVCPEWSAEDAGYDDEAEWEEVKAGLVPCVVISP